MDAINAEAAGAATGSPLRVMHVITDLGQAGAQMMLFKLLTSLTDSNSETIVVSLGSLGPLGGRLREKGFEVHALELKNPRRGGVGFIELFRLMRRFQPEVVQTWMYHADLIGGVLARLAGSRHLIWNVRCTELPATEKLLTRIIARICGFLARTLPDAIITCSAVAIDTHERLGYPREKFMIIPNGFDTARFHPDPVAYREVRRELGVPRDALIAGLAGRYHPVKDHATFLAAAALLNELENVYFVLCGTGVDPLNDELMPLVRATGCEARVRLLGSRNDVPRITAAFDVAISSSMASEAFSNTLGEAMASGVPCVATDAGGNRSIVGDAGIVVPVRNPRAMADAMRAVLSSTVERARLGSLARHRVEQNFELRRVAERYLGLYMAMARTDHQGEN